MRRVAAIALLAADPARVRLVPFDDPRPLADIDTPEDYAELRSQESKIRSQNDDDCLL